MSSSKLSTDLGDPKLLKMLKQEAAATDSSMKDVLVNALENYFGHRLETKALMKLSESVFEEWNNELDQDYDKL